MELVSLTKQTEDQANQQSTTRVRDGPTTMDNRFIIMEESRRNHFDDTRWVEKK